MYTSHVPTLCERFAQHPLWRVLLLSSFLSSSLSWTATCFFCCRNGGHILFFFFFYSANLFSRLGNDISWNDALFSLVKHPAIVRPSKPFLASFRPSFSPFPLTHRWTMSPSPVDAKLPLTGGSRRTKSPRPYGATPGFGETIERSLHLQRCRPSYGFGEIRFEGGTNEPSTIRYLLGGRTRGG